MKAVSIAEAKDKLSALVEEADSTHEIFTITRHGRAAAVLMSTDDLESLHETLFWLSLPGVRESIEQAERELAAGQTVGGDELRAEFGLPPR